MFITVFSQKGEQAKTSTAVNLAAALAKGGRRGTIVDLDPQQSDALKFTGSIDGVVFTDILPAIAPDGEFVMVDLSPFVGPQTGVALLRSDLVLVPCTPHAASTAAAARTFETIALARQKRPELQALLAFTRVDKSQHAVGVLSSARAFAEWPVAQTVIPARLMEFERAFAARRPVVCSAPKSLGALAYCALAREIEEILHASL